MLINEKNENILKTSISLHEAIDLDEHDEVAVELKKLDQKMDLLLDMIGELLTQKNDSPEKVSIRLTAHSLACESKKLVKLVDKQTTKKVKICLYINPSIPSALNLFGEVKLCENIDTIDNSFDVEAIVSNMIVVNFFGLSQAVKDQLEKIIFRHHRKIIARERAFKDS